MRLKIFFGGLALFTVAKKQDFRTIYKRLNATGDASATINKFSGRVEGFNVVFNEGIMGAAKHNGVWGSGDVFEERFKKVFYKFLIVGLVVFFDGICEARAGEELDVLIGFSVFFNKGFGAGGGDGVWCGHDKNVSYARVGSDFDGWFGADKLNGGVFFAKVGDMAGSGGVTSDNDNLGAPVGELLGAGRGDFLKFFRGLLAIRTVFSVGDIFIFFVWEKFFSGIKNGGATNARVE